MSHRNLLVSHRNLWRNLIVSHQNLLVSQRLDVCHPYMSQLKNHRLLGTSYLRNLWMTWKIPLRPSSKYSRTFDTGAYRLMATSRSRYTLPREHAVATRE